MHFQTIPLGLRLLAVLSFAAPITSHAFEFRVLSWTGNLKNLRYENEGKSLPLRGTEGALSEVYTVKGTAPLEIFREDKRGEKIVRTVLATLPVPPRMKQAILVLAPIDAERRGYTGLWIDDAPETRRVNQVQFRNLSSRDVAVVAGGSDLRLSPQDTRQFAFDDNARLVPMRVAAQIGTEWQLISTSAQPVRPGFRILVLLRDGRKDDDGTHRAVDLVTLYDYMPPKI